MPRTTLYTMNAARHENNGENQEEPEKRPERGQLGFEARLWATVDKLRGKMERSDYKHVAFGLIFLKYISEAFET